MRRQLAVGAVAILVVLSGCSALPFGGDGAGDGPTVDSVEYPDGASQSGIDDPATVVQTHQQALSQTSFVIVQEQQREVGDQSIGVTLEITVDPESERFSSQTTRANMSAESYYEDGTVYSQQVANGSTNYTVQSFENRSYDTLHQQFTAGRTIGQLLTTVDLEAENVRQSGDTTLIVYNVTGISQQAQQQTQEGEEPDVSGTVVIDTEGRIHQVQIQRAGQVQSINLEIRFDQIGTAEVESPQWLDEAKEQADRTDSMNETDTATDTATENETDSN